MMIYGRWHDNVSCPRCRFRHPAFITCEFADRLAREEKTKNTRHIPEVCEPEGVTLHLEGKDHLPPGAYDAKIYAIDTEGNFLIRVIARREE